MSKECKKSFEIAPGRSIEMATGKLAKLANGSCTVRLGDTILFVAACTGTPRPGTDFLPLQVDYREKYTAAGGFPGGYIKREGRPSTKEILTCRLTDRPLRPLFPKGYFDEIQVQALLLSADGKNDSDILCILGASLALTLSDAPFQGPIGAVRVGYVDGEFVANPTNEERAKSSLELIYAGLEDKVIMIEGEGKIIPEQLLKDAMAFANEIVKVQIKAQLELREEALAAGAAREKKEPNLQLVPEAITKRLAEICGPKMKAASTIPGKEERQAALAELEELAATTLEEEFPEEENLGFWLKIGFDDLVKDTIRAEIINNHFRPDGRALDELRPIEAEVDVLPVVHGSGLFSRGETQALVITALGGKKDTQETDDITNGISRTTQKFYLHYNFPNYSVGEVGRIAGPGRREIGHGNLAERSVEQVIPKDFPYTIRCVSEVMASNGSTSMASVCGATLSLMDAGVPITAPVAGISCGLVTDENNTLLLTDILGAEDHFGDMDFKVCGTREGITGFQLDLKLPGISLELLNKAIDRNFNVRLKILDIMEECIKEPRAKLHDSAPRMQTIQINPSKIGALIGPGGKNIKELTENTGAQIDITDDGTVTVMADSKEKMDSALEQISAATAEAEIGKIYRGTVKGVKDFGAFVEILPGKEGLLHISELADYRVKAVSDICKEGDKVTVKVLDIDRSGKIRLSRKAALAELDSE